jgi:hypothetical protein
MFATYITIYRGNKLPPFYIGYSSVKKIENGYNGSVTSKIYKEIWKRERINNPQLFKTKIIKRHSTRKEALLYEENLHKKLDVDHNSLYINQIKSRNYYFNRGGYKLTEETKKKQSDSWTEERKRSSGLKISERNKKRWADPEYKQRVGKNISRALTGRTGHSKGIQRTNEVKKKISLSVSKNMENPDFIKHLSKKAKERCTPEWRKRKSEDNKQRVCCIICGMEMGKSSIGRHQQGSKCIPKIDPLLRTGLHP